MGQQNCHTGDSCEIQIAVKSAHNAERVGQPIGIREHGTKTSSKIKAEICLSCLHRTLNIKQII